MVAAPRWRALLCRLADTHPRCLLLTYAQKQIADGGFQADIAAVSSSANQLPVFLSVFACVPWPAHPA